MRAFLGCLLLASTARATIIPVDTFNDSLDGGDGLTSLRGAIQQANAVPGTQDTIQLGEGTFVLQISGRDEDAAATGDLDNLGDLILVGTGANPSVIDGNFLDRVFQNHNGAVLELQNVLIQNGQSDADGGGILNNGGTLTLRGTTVSGNFAFAADPMTSEGVGRGGGVFSSGGTVDIIDSTINGNGASRAGGGIWNDTGTANLINNTVIDSNNAARQGGLSQTAARETAGMKKGHGASRPLGDKAPYPWRSGRGA